jgi:hypothetical protein
MWISLDLANPDHMSKESEGLILAKKYVKSSLIIKAFIFSRAVIYLVFCQNVGLKISPECKVKM